jgi:hypothetical protein
MVANVPGGDVRNHRWAHNKPVPLDRGQSGDGLGSLGDLLIDAAQGPPGPGRP